MKAAPAATPAIPSVPTIVARLPPINCDALAAPLSPFATAPIRDTMPPSSGLTVLSAAPIEANDSLVLPAASPSDLSPAALPSAAFFASASALATNLTALLTSATAFLASLPVAPGISASFFLRSAISAVYVRETVSARAISHSLRGGRGQPGGQRLAPGLRHARACGRRAPTDSYWQGWRQAPSAEDSAR